MINKEMTISEILDVDKGIAPILMNNGMHCLGCIAASGESLEEACAVHGIDVDNLVQEINTFLQEQ